MILGQWCRQSPLFSNITTIFRTSGQRCTQHSNSNKTYLNTSAQNYLKRRYLTWQTPNIATEYTLHNKHKCTDTFNKVHLPCRYTHICLTNCLTHRSMNSKMDITCRSLQTYLTKWPYIHKCGHNEQKYLIHRCAQTFGVFFNTL